MIDRRSTRRLRLEKLFYLELSRSPNGRFGHLRLAVSEVKRPLRIRNSFRSEAVKNPPAVKNNMHRPFTSGYMCPFGCIGYVTAVAVNQSQRLYSGIRIFTWYYLIFCWVWVGVDLRIYDL
jgi:hypothetical protein